MHPSTCTAWDEAGFQPRCPALLSRVRLPVFAHQARTRCRCRRPADAPYADPFDRILVAQALIEPMRLMTHDLTVARYSDAIIAV